MNSQRHPQRYAMFAAAALAVAWALDFLVLIATRDGFSWMDPYQYYGFAQAVLTGGRAWNEFEVASIFPYLLMPGMAIAGPSVPAALGTHVWITLLLLGGLLWLCRELGWRGFTWQPVLLWLGTPLAIGLAHELYSETALAMLVMLALAAMLRAARLGTWGAALLAAGLAALTVMLKMTAPVFFLGPVAVLMLAAGRSPERWRSLLRMAVCAAGCLALVAGLQLTVFSASWAYWRSLGNTAIPIMHLIGPSQTSPFWNVAYYVRVLLLYCLPGGILGILLLLPAMAGFWRRNAAAQPAPDQPWRIRFLAAWILVPLVVFTIQEVKEPRHILPCVPAVVVLLAGGIQGLQRPWLRNAVWAFTTILCVGQYVYSTRISTTTPYLLRGPTGAAEAADVILQELLPQLINQPGAGQSGSPIPPEIRTWALYNLDVGIAGLPPNEALALAWALKPANIERFDIMNFPLGERGAGLPFTRFEDIYVYSAFNFYNARSGWWRPYVWNSQMPYRAVIRPEGVPWFAWEGQAPGKEFRIERPGNPGGALIVRISELPANLLGTRQEYALDHLSRRNNLPPEERRTILAALRRAYVLRQDWAGLKEMALNYPELLDPALEPGRNIYWFGMYSDIDRIERALWEQRPAGIAPPDTPAESH